jgi:nicotinate-nucleotide adenylyltransferase
LQEKNPLDTFFLCIGEDSLASFHTWWHFRDILSKVPLVVANRPGVDCSGISRDILERAIFVDHEQVDVSSTEIRKKARTGDDTLKTLVPEAVAMYILQHNLYSE